MTKTTRIFTMNDLKVPSVVDAVRTRMHVEDNELISSSLAYSSNVQAFVKEAPDFWPTYLKGRDIGLIPSHWTDDDAYDQFMVDTVKSLNKLPFRIQLTALTCLERNLPMTQVTVVDVKAGIASYDRSVLTITTGLDISLFAYVFHHVVSLLDDDCRRSSTLKPDGSFVFEINIFTNNRKDHAKSCYINLTGLEAERLTIYSCESVLLPESVGFKLSDDTKVLIATLEQDVYTKVRECLERDYGLRVSFIGVVSSVQKHTDQQNYVKAIDCILVNRNQFPVRKEHLNELVTSVISIKKLAKAVSNIPVLPPVPIKENIMDDPKPPAPENTGEPVYTFMQPEISSFYNLPTQSDYVVQPPPPPECLNPPHPAIVPLDTLVSTSFPEPEPHIHTEKEVIMTLPEIKNGELAELFAKIDALETKVKEQEKRLELITVQELRPVPGSFSVFKVAELPKSLRPDSMYFVGDTASRKFDIYVSGVNGEMYSLNRHKEEKQHVVAARTLELSDPIAVRRWLEEAKCTATYIAMYLKATNPPTTAKEIELQKLKSVSQLLEETTATLEKISDKAERQCQLLELDLAKVVHNSTVGAFASIPKHNVKVQNSSASGCVARTEQPTGPSLTEQVRSHVANSKELIKQTHQKPDTGMELTGWRELSALAKHLNIDLSDTYVFLTSDGKVEIREHVMFPSKETLDQIGKSPSPTTNSLTEHPMSKTALVHNVDILFMTIQGREQCVDAVEIGNYNEQIRDLFFAIERELAMRTESSVSEIAHSGYKVSVNYIPIPDAAPLCSRMFQIGKDGRNLSFAFYDSTPIRLAPQPAAPSNSDGSDLTWQAAPLRQA